MTVPHEFVDKERTAAPANDQASSADRGPFLRPVPDAPTPAPQVAPTVTEARPPLPSLPALIREDLVAHGRDFMSPGFQALAVHRFGVWRMGIESRLLRAPLSLIYRALHRAATGVYGIELPYTAKIGRRVVVEHQHGIVVHGRTVIGDDCILRQGVTLGIRSMDRLDDAPVLGNGVNIGAGAKIIGHVHVGDGAQVGANAVVLHDVPAGALVVGIPATVVPRRKPG